MQPAAITLRPMTPEEFEDYLARAIPEYADGHLRAGNVASEDSLRRAQEDYAALLPQGLNTPGHHIFCIESGAEAVGMCWFEVKKKNARVRAFIFDIYLDESRRGQGLGRKSMAELESRARDLGAQSLGLHVFGDNLAARSLYEKCGFGYADIVMTKSLD